jgi:hypothetical protein
MLSVSLRNTSWKWGMVFLVLPSWLESDSSMCVWHVWQGLCDGCPGECTGCKFALWQQMLQHLLMFCCQVCVGEV